MGHTSPGGGKEAAQSTCGGGTCRSLVSSSDSRRPACARVSTGPRSKVQRANTSASLGGGAWPEAVPQGLRDPALYPDEFKRSMGLPAAASPVGAPFKAGPRPPVTEKGPPARMPSCGADEPAPGPQELSSGTRGAQSAAAAAAAAALMQCVEDEGMEPAMDSQRDTLVVRNDA